MYKRILVATDGSKLSAKAVESAIDLASSAGADLIALSVVARYPTSYFEGGMTMSNAEVATIENAWSAKAQALVDKVANAAMLQGVKAKAIVFKSDLVAESIMKVAQKHKCDLIVMSSHGRKGIKRLLLGSETQHVLTHGDVPVLVLR